MRTVFTIVTMLIVTPFFALMVILAGSSAVLAPVLLQLLLPLASGGQTARVDAGRIVSTLALVQFLPLCVGLAVRARRPAWAQRLRKPLGRLSALLNLSLLVLVLAAQFHLLAHIRVRGYFGMLVLLAGGRTALGAGPALLLGFAAALLCRLIAPWCGGAVTAMLVAVAVGAALGLHLAAALPFALAGESPGRAGLAAGLYLGGAMAGSQLAGWLLA